MKRISLLLLILLPFFTVQAQNLVLNPSFEQTGNVPCGWITSQPQFAAAVANWTAPNGGTSDIHSTQVGQSCWNFQPNSTYSGFECWRGPQMPRTGNIMGGIFTHVQNSTWREYLHVPFSAPMTIGVPYVVEVWVSHADYSSRASNNMGIYLSTTPTAGGGFGTLPFVPQILETNIINNNLTWVRVGDTITPTQAYQYLIIGNFYQNAQTTIINHTGSCSGAYYYIDDCRVERVPLPNLRDTTICPGDSVTFAVPGGDGPYIWYTQSQPNTIIGTDTFITVAPLVTTTYIVEGQTTLDTVIVTVLPPAPAVALGNDTTICSGTVLIIDPGNVGNTYSWYPGGQNTQSISVNTGGQYAVTATNVCGTDWDTVTVTVLQQHVVGLGPDTLLCTGDVLTLDAGNPGMSYLWSNNDTNQTIQVTGPGQYWVEVTGYCGAIRDTINVTYLSPPTTNLGPDTLICNGNSITLDAGISPSSSYLWNTGATTQTISVNTAGTYSVTVTNYCGTASDAIVISIGQAPVIDLGPDTLVCQGTILLLDASDQNPNPLPATYLWSTGQTTATILTTSLVVYSVTVTNPCGTTTDVINISYMAPPVATLGPDTTICQGTTITLNPDPLNQNTGSTYIWNTGATTQSLTVGTAGAYAVTVTNMCGVDAAVQTVWITTEPEVDLGNDRYVCIDDNFTLNAGNAPAGTSYLWSTGATTQSITVNSSTQTYSVTLSNQCGTVTDDILLTTAYPPEVNLGPDIEVCEGEVPIRFDVRHPWAHAYVWQDGTIGGILDVTQTGTYSVELEGICGVVRDEIFVEVHPDPEITLGPDTTICDDRTITLDPGAGYMIYQWSTGSDNQTLIVDYKGRYRVTVTDENMCSDWSEIDIFTEKCPENLYIPNVFSPNGDGLNDLFFPVENDIKVTSFFVYDRWGKLIHQGSSANDAWDGKFGGEVCQEGNYVWKIGYVNLFGETGTTAGSVLLVR